MNLNEIFSTQERVRILYAILTRPRTPIRVRGLASQLNLSVGLVSQYLVVLSKAGIVSKIGRGFRVNMDNSVTRAIKLFLNVSELDVGIIRAEVGDNLLGVGFYGSWAKGTNDEESDVDLWIKVRNHVDEVKIARTMAELTKELGREVNILVLDFERVKRLKEEDPIFYYSLVFGSFTLWGENIET